MTDALDRLRALGAQALPHVNGDLLEHLRGTWELLRKWGNRESLCNAGLFHSVYGTEGYDMRLVTASDRTRVIEAIGEEAERIVYEFGVCDRDHFYLELIRYGRTSFRDRFSGEVRTPSERDFADLCELTLANEVQVIQAGSDAWRRTQKLPLLSLLFAKMQPHLSEAGYADWLALRG